MSVLNILCFSDESFARELGKKTDDRDVERFLKYFTDLDPDEIKLLCERERNINKLKIILANLVEMQII